MRKLDILTILLVLLALIVTPAAQAEEHFSVGTLSSSYHIKERTFDCDGVDRQWNEDNNGVYVQYKGFIYGRYENSYSGCNGLKYSNLIGYEFELGEWWEVEFSGTAALADGYPGKDQNIDHEMGEYRVSATINAKWKFLKIYYGYAVIAAGLEIEF